MQRRRRSAEGLDGAVEARHRDQNPGRGRQPCRRAPRRFDGGRDTAVPRQFGGGAQLCHRAGLLRVGVRHLPYEGRRCRGGARIGGVLHQQPQAVGAYARRTACRRDAGQRGTAALAGRLHRRGARGGNHAPVARRAMRRKSVRAAPSPSGSVRSPRRAPWAAMPGG